MLQPTNLVYEHPITVLPIDIDALGHVNNVVYVKWVQEVAAAHWQKLSTPTIQANYLWVVIRHEIDYAAPAFLHDTIIAKTWVGVHSGAKSMRYVQIINKESGKVLAEATTAWCLLDAATLRPKRIDDEMKKIFLQAV